MKFLTMGLVWASILMADIVPEKSLQKVWTVKQGISNPQSVGYDSSTGLLYVANMSGEPGQKDGNGWISRLTSNGAVSEEKWISGFHAPKGVRGFQGRLWLTDIDQVVVIDIRSAKVQQKIKVPGAKFLTDTAVDDRGKVYVSDPLTSYVYVVESGKALPWVRGDEWESPKGLLIQGDKLFVAAWGLTTDFANAVAGHLYTISLVGRKKNLIAPTLTGNWEGIERDQKGNLLVSESKSGGIYRINTSTGHKELLMSAHPGVGDLGYIPSRNLLIVPDTQASEVSAYSLPEQ